MYRCSQRECVRRTLNFVRSLPQILSSLPHPVHLQYKATGGYCREEAIMLLRQFYITENTNGKTSLSFVKYDLSQLHQAPVPKSKANRALKIEIAPNAYSPSEVMLG